MSSAPASERAGGFIASAARPLWIDRPWIDLLIGCGGWSIPLLLLSYAVVDRDVPVWSAVFYGLAIVCNYPHYMATIYRAYGREDRDQYRLYTHYLTAALVLVGIAAHLRFAIVPWLFTAYLMWSPWHYSGQNYGLLMMFLRRAGIDVSSDERRQLRGAFVGSYLMLIAAFNNGPSRDPLVLSIGLPAWAAVAIEAVTAGVFVLGGVTALITLARRSPRGSLVAPLTLYVTQASWFVLPVAATWIATASLPQARYSSGMLALMHSAQYLWITRYFARREAERAGSRWNVWSYAATLVLGGLALFLPVPWLASYLAHADFTASVLIVASVVNLHHFLLDGVVWKLRDPRVGQVLAGRGPASTEGPAAATPALGWRPWRTLAAAALVTLAALDQWRYVVATGAAGPGRLQAATALNPYDSSAHTRIAQAAAQAGDTARAESAFRRAIEANLQNPAPALGLERLLIEAGRTSDAYAQCLAVLERWPNHVDTLVNAGVLASRLGDRAAAARWWQRALDRDPALGRVHLYLAELLDEDGAEAALQHYQAYLGFVVGRGRGSAEPREVIPVIVKFGDALAKHGRRDQADSQYRLAGQMAQQTRLADLERVARERLEDLAR